MFARVSYDPRDIFISLFVCMSDKASSNPWFGVSLGLMGLIIGYAIGSIGTTSASLPALPSGGTQQPTPTAQAPAETQYDPAGVDDDPVLGDENAPITLIEFTDYQCPFCSRFFTQTYPQIKSEYIDSGDVKYVVRDYPLSFHPHAQITAEASECADDQGKFWEMHDLLFSKQAEWNNASDIKATLVGFASDLGLDTGSFESCLDNGTHTQEVKDDMSDGAQAGIGGTPGFWILGPNGEAESVSGAYPFDHFKGIIDGML